MCLPPSKPPLPRSCFFERGTGSTPVPLDFFSPCPNCGRCHHVGRGHFLPRFHATRHFGEQKRAVVRSGVNSPPQCSHARLSGVSTRMKPPRFCRITRPAFLALRLRRALTSRSCRHFLHSFAPQCIFSTVPHSWQRRATGRDLRWKGRNGAMDRIASSRFLSLSD